MPLLGAGIDTSTIALWLGHEQERTTLDGGAGRRRGGSTGQRGPACQRRLVSRLSAAGQRLDRRSELARSVESSERFSPEGYSGRRPGVRNVSTSTLQPRGVLQPDGHLTPRAPSAAPARTSGDAVATARQHDARRSLSDRRRTGPLPHHRVDPGAHAGGEQTPADGPATTCSDSMSAPGAAGRVRRGDRLSQRAARLVRVTT